MSIISNTEALVAELYTIGNKAEIVDGEIVMMSPTGYDPGRAAGTIYISLRAHESKTQGFAIPDNVAFLVDLPNRKSFSPDAAFHTGPSTDMKFLDRAPDFAAEVRSEGDYGPAAEREMKQKRTDYFAAGTKVVWDVDLLGEDVFRVYRTATPEEPTIFRKGDQAEAEPAVPGWTMNVDSLFD